MKQTSPLGADSDEYLVLTEEIIRHPIDTFGLRLPGAFENNRTGIVERTC